MSQFTSNNQAGEAG